ncbi:MAG: type II toxin-antitoxin system RelE/ParE family toxin [Blastocatellia bacterium]
MDYRFHPHALSELDDALTYYLKVNPELASDFLSEVESAIGRILQFPEAWTKLSPTIRRCRTRRLPYGIVYKLAKNRVLIVAVMHLHREPNYWADRV